jgi:hypothetical protein
MKKVLFSLLAIFAVATASAQCDPIASINENFDSWVGNPFGGEMGIGECWSTEPNGGYVYGEQNVTFYAFMSPNLDMYLILPEIVPGSYDLIFDVAVAGDITDGITVETGTVESNDDVSTFDPFYDPNAVTGETQTISQVIQITEESRYYAIKIHTTAPHSAAFIDNLVLSPRLSVNDVNEIQVSAYPNPAVNQLNLTSKSQIKEVKIFGLNGELVKIQKANANSTQIEVSDLNAGIYIAQILTDKGIKTIKLIKK